MRRIVPFLTELPLFMKQTSVFQFTFSAFQLQSIFNFDVLCKCGATKLLSTEPIGFIGKVMYTLSNGGLSDYMDKGITKLKPLL